MTASLRATVTGVAGVTSATALVAPTEDSVSIELDTSTTAVQGDATFKITLTNDDTGSFVTSSEAKTFLRGRPGSIDTTYGTLGYAAPKAVEWSALFVLSTGETIVQAYTQSFGNTSWSAEVLSSNGRKSQATFALPSYGLGGLTATVDRADQLVTFGGRQGQGTLSRFTKDGLTVPFSESSLPLYGGVVNLAAINDETFLVLHDAVIKFDAAGVKVYEAQAPAPSVDVPTPGSPIGISRLDGKDVLSTSGGGSTRFWGRGSSGHFDAPAGTFYFAPDAKGVSIGPRAVPYYLTSRCAVKDIQGTLCIEPNEATTLLTNLYFSSSGKAALFGRRLVSGSTQYVVRFFDQNARELLEISIPNDANVLPGGFFGEEHFFVSTPKGVVRYWL
jgi:hypothetical protein